MNIHTACVIPLLITYHWDIEKNIKSSEVAALSIATGINKLPEQFVTHPKIKKRFRQLSRHVAQLPNDARVHRQRIDVAMQFYESDPVQGALADYFFGCWYDVAFEGQEILDKVAHKLRAGMYDDFAECVNRQGFVLRSSQLATEWSVLLTPSLQVPAHRQRTSRDYSWYIADKVVEELLFARQASDIKQIKHLEEEFFLHCLACADKIAFMKVWFQLNKRDWVLDARWQRCRESLESLSGEAL